MSCRTRSSEIGALADMLYGIVSCRTRSSETCGAALELKHGVSCRTRSSEMKAQAERAQGLVSCRTRSSEINGMLTLTGLGVSCRTPVVVKESVASEVIQATCFSGSATVTWSSRSGLSDTVPIGVQLRVLPLHRAGLASRAA